MALHLHDIQTEEQSDILTGEVTKRILRCNFYLPFMPEQVHFSTEVKEFPPEEEREAFLLEAIQKDLETKPELKIALQTALEKEKQYLESQIATHDLHRQQCVERLAVLENPFC